MEKVVFTGSRLFMKFPKFEYFEKRLKDIDCKLVEVRDESNDVLKAELKDAAAVVLIARKMDAEIIGSDALTDIALLKVDPEGLTDLEVVIREIKEGKLNQPARIAVAGIPAGAAARRCLCIPASRNPDGEFCRLAVPARQSAGTPCY